MRKRKKVRKNREKGGGKKKREGRWKGRKEVALDAMDLGKGISSSDNSAEQNINRKECFKDISILPHNRKADKQNLKPVNVPIISHF